MYKGELNQGLQDLTGYMKSLMNKWQIVLIKIMVNNLISI